MSHDLTLASEYSADAINVPEDGDDLDAQQVEDALQLLGNRALWARTLLQGLIVGQRHLYSGTPSTGIGVFLGGLDHVVIGSQSFAVAAGTEVPGTLPLAAFVYVYAYDNGGALGLQVSADTPDATLTWKSTGVGTHLYLGTVPTDGAGTVIPFEAVAGHYRYRNAPASRRPLNAGTATTPGAAIDCSPYAPAHARMLHLGLTFVASGANGNASVLRVSGEAGGDYLEIKDGQSYSKDSFMPCDSTRSLQYIVSGASVNLTAYVHGWRERA